MRQRGPDRVRPAFETAILLATVVALLLPAAASLAALIALVLLWLAARPPRQERVFVGFALALASALILISILSQRLGEPDAEAWSRELESGFADFQARPDLP